ncbi:TIGR03503 family protein [Alteromonas sp. 345S023]|uniref:TIGR03503 family protein n=1 Tax=Alteromonas profundi TaxID=2696062 RepID=A0A7X5LIK7_9ALTE|nr:TIGR03503 family protein [Alteromonas profundi]NDV90020.1 TIGR03503 family protein [Alteromonas profundi]
MVLLAAPVTAQTSAENNQPPATSSPQAESEPSAESELSARSEPSASPLTELGDAYENSIKLLQNRFRVDYNVKELTMVFFREYGSSPVVLVRPDGSKIFQGRHNEEKVEWHDDATYDMVRIKNPMPGPWQAVGQVLPESRLMVVSDLQLIAEPLPTTLFSGEILKSSAYLTNGNEAIDINLFSDVVDLRIDFISTNDSNFDNFGTPDQEIARFEDNGRGMDEQPYDGVFTGQFNLNIAPGEWLPVFSVTTPLFSREQRGDPIILHPNPVTISAEVDGGGEGYHKITIDVDRELVDINSLIVDGKIRFPNTDVQNFSITESTSDAREHLIVAYEEGVYRVKLTAYGTTMDGRDFILDVPEFNFVATAPEPEVIDPLINGEDPIVDGSEPTLRFGVDGENAASKPGFSDTDVGETKRQEAIDADTFTTILIVANGSILLLGLIAAVIIIVMRKKRAISLKTAPTPTKRPKKAITEEDLSLDNEPSGLKKWLSVFKKK